jgi:hypothetical protein
MCRHTTQIHTAQHAFLSPWVAHKFVACQHQPTFVSSTAVALALDSKMGASSASSACKQHGQEAFKIVMSASVLAAICCLSSMVRQRGIVLQPGQGIDSIENN